MSKLLKKYPGVFYTNSITQGHAVLFITVTLDTYHGTRTVTETQRLPAIGFHKEFDHHQQPRKPYTVEYGIFYFISRTNAA